jgi:hypothetical protein
MAGEDERVGVGLDELRQVTGKVVTDVRRDRDPAPPGFGLRWSLHESSPDVHDLLAHVYPAVEQVDVPSAKPAQLTKPKAATDRPSTQPLDSSVLPSVGTR